MPPAIKVKKKHGQKTHNLLKELDLLNNNYKVKRTQNHLYIPTKKPSQTQLKQIKQEINQFQITNTKLQERNKGHKNLEDYLKPHLTTQEIKKVPSSFDIIGDIAIVEIPEPLIEKQNLIGKALMKVHRNLEAVYKPKTNVQGELRTREHKLIAGKPKTETVHKEHGVKYLLDINEVFFTPRLAREREIIAKQIQPGEIVFDMFAGVGPFAILIARKTKSQKVYAVDKNPKAIEYLQINADMNNVTQQIETIEGDIRNVSKMYQGTSDRAIMNLPFKSGQFIDQAINLLHKDKGIIHYYDIRKENDLYETAIQEITKKVHQRNLDLEILDKRNVRSYSPGVQNIAIDIKIK
ncbi:class I SAM-dependent methyltransferase family protein [Methanonatronarchaeum sp. AMET6-2]|uniref:class I SAM-dependent methyltransferase n=1 Tax=Methanonatronarchaeum sp. AMET6-2 TaxID=2933293 RepID=UPI001210FEC1|nr:class I SAM-dependent methyltransferase family protein [Methanonatronarchaeum sp. AMET6-2]RZN62645.1 MAG: class I SAM-dependent methyltransferase family protein [Methanonatronarchaeia archaeon]UOY10047.1 class I SAM-dependent methyltransferase family protein [Methanonatronarchaeum sp. AMET6-2]